MSELLRWMRTIAASAASAASADVSDVLLLVGGLLLFVGLALCSWSLALSVVGALLVFGSLLSHHARTVAATPAPEEYDDAT